MYYIKLKLKLETEQKKNKNIGGDEKEVIKGLKGQKTANTIK